MTLEVKPKNGKFRNNPPVDSAAASTLTVNYLNTLSKERGKLREIVNKNFNNRSYVLEACLSVKAQSLISDITLPFCLILLGQPASHKSTMLDLVNSLPDCYKSDFFTSKSFVSHAANISEENLSNIDLLPRIKNKTLITPELAPIFSAKEEHLTEIIGILIRILDGKGYQSDSGSRGRRGYSEDCYFTWIGAVVEISRYVWKTLGNLGPKMYFLRIPTDAIPEEEKQQKMIANLKDKSYNIKLEEAKKQLQSFWELVKAFLNQINGKIVWNTSKDDPLVLEKLAKLAQILASLRASIPTYDTYHSGGSNYNYESPIIEDPQRALTSLYNLTRGHAVICGRNFITHDDLGVAMLVAFSSAPKERVELFKLLIENNGKINTSQFIEKAKVSIATALKNMEQLSILKLVEKTEEQTLTKPITAIKLKDSYSWFLTEEFRSYLDNLYS